MKCIGCKYYDASVDCCNADEHCYTEGYEKGRADAIDEYKHSQMMDKALIIAHAEMFFRWWYQKDIEMGTYSDEEIKGIMSDYLEQLKEQKDE